VNPLAADFSGSRREEGKLDSRVRGVGEDLRRVGASRMAAPSLLFCVAFRGWRRFNERAGREGIQRRNEMREEQTGRDNEEEEEEERLPRNTQIRRRWNEKKGMKETIFVAPFLSLMRRKRADKTTHAPSLLPPKIDC
jgi:hypothetical protein